MDKRNSRPRIINLCGKEILEQILAARASLEQEAEYGLLKVHRVSDYLKTEANKHSADMETGKRKRRVREKARENLRSAQEFFSKVYRGSLGHDILFDTEELILGSKGRVPYRSPDTRVMAQGMAFFYPRDVRGELDNFFLESDTITNPVEKALHSHLHIARVHPFYDGNGRLARLVQNGILDKAGLPPIIISQEERQNYMDLINAAQREYRDNSGLLKSGQVAFYCFLVKKLSDSLKQFQGRLASRR